MFTGIVQAIGEIRTAGGKARGGEGSPTDLRIRGPWSDLEPGESVAVDGACLTVASCDRDGVFAAQASAETLRRTTLGRMRTGSKVHLERAVRASDRLGGHLVTGHVDAVARVASAEDAGGGTRILEIEAPAALERQIAEKGSVALDGVSLTVNGVREGRFTVTIVAHTAGATKLGEIRAGDDVNVETDILAKYVERALGRGGAAGDGVTMEALERAGFLGGGRGK